MQHVIRFEDVGATRIGLRPTATNLILLSSDVVSLTATAALGALWARALLPAESAAFLLQLWPVLVVLPGIFVLTDLYPGAGMSPVDEMRIIVTAVSAFAAAVLAALFLTTGLSVQLIYATLLTLVCGALLVPSGRVLLRHVFSHLPWWGVPVTILGAGKTAAMVIERLRRYPNLNLKVVACLDDDPMKWESKLEGVPVSGPIAAAAELRDRRVNYAIVAMPGLEPHRLASLVHELGRHYAKVVIIPNAMGMTSVGVGTRDSGGLVGFYVRGHLSHRSNLLLKRALDLLLLAPLGLLALPVILACSAAVAIASPGNPFFAQEREGFQGRKIRIWKLRTMRPDADEVLKRHLESDLAAKAEWEARFKLSRDPRVIPVVGNLLRRLSLDELPQLLNIARGELSFVGPRPFPYYHLECFEDEFRTLRASVVPGLTGYWQVTSRSTADLLGQVELDSYYINNWSLWLDLYVLVRTPWAVLFGVGAY